MKIGINLNEVLRDFIGQVEYTYNKYILEGEDDVDIDIEENPVTSFDLIKHFPFDSVEELNKFLYEEAALEIFGHADELYHNLINQLNYFIMDMKDLYGHEVIIISREVMTAIPSTLFFLSKTSCKCENIKFVETYEKQWDEVDILITANPEVLKCKPEDKISVKVEASYNQDVKGDFNVGKLFEVIIEDSPLLEKIIKAKKEKND
jgi:hypothetical protein